MTKWTDDDIATLRRLLRAGETYSAIAAVIGVSRNAVHGKASRLGLTGAAGRAVYGSVAASEVGARCAPAEPWTADDVEALHTLAFRKTAAEIGASLGRSASAVRDKARGLGLRLCPGERRPPGPSRRKGMVRPPAPAPVTAVAAPPDEAGPVDGVLFVDRRAFQCAAIVDEATPILERRVCGRRVSGGTAWCAEHRRLFTERRRVA